MVATHCERAYLTADPPIRRQINQGFFEKLFIGEDSSVVRAILTEPFAALLADQDMIFVTAWPENAESASQIVPDAPAAPDDSDDRTSPASVLAATYGDRNAVTPCAQSTTV
ncbi:MAG TPA: hypothetical protein VJ914_34080 [Pseudonocardiaceae bacterium]|nr:hypothetical protein [Pseudonocardiaceae bacterium]